MKLNLVAFTFFLSSWLGSGGHALPTGDISTDNNSNNEIIPSLLEDTTSNRRTSIVTRSARLVLGRVGVDEGKRPTGGGDAIIFLPHQPSSSSTSSPDSFTTTKPNNVQLPGIPDSSRVIYPGDIRTPTEDNPNPDNSKCLNLLTSSLFPRAGDHNAASATKCTLAQGTVMHEGVCKRLLAQEDCVEGEWLVLIEGDSDTNAIAACKKRPCPFGQLEYEGKCVNPSDAESVCRYGQTLYVEMTGETYCDCEQGFTYDIMSGNCYARHEQGPCSFGHYLDIGSDCSLVCVPNECEVNGFIRGKEEEKTCYRKMYYGFCEQTYQIFHAGNNTVECSASLWRSIFDVISLRTCPEGSRRDYNHECKQLFNIPSSTAYPSLYGECGIGFQMDRRGTCRRVHSVLI